MEEETERRAGKKTEKKPEREHEGAMRRRIPVGKLAPALTAAMILIIFAVKTAYLLHQYPQVEIPLATLYGAEDENLRNLSRDGTRLRAEAADTRIHFAFDDTVPIRCIGFEADGCSRSGCRTWIYLDDCWQQGSVRLQDGNNYVGFEDAGPWDKTSSITVTPTSIRGVSFDLLSFTVNPWEHIAAEELQNAALLLMVCLLTEGVALALLKKHSMSKHLALQHAASKELTRKTVAAVSFLQAFAGIVFLWQYVSAEWTGVQTLYHTALLAAEGLFLLLLYAPRNNLQADLPENPDNDPGKKKALELPALRILLLSVYCFGMTELLYGDMFLMDNLWSALLNLLVYAVPYALLYGCFGRRREHFAYLIGTIWWGFFAMVNHYYFEYRAQAFELSDLTMVGTAKNVMLQYRLDITPDVLLVYVTAALLILALVKEDRGALPEKNRKKRVAGFAVGAALTAVVLSNLPAVNLWNTNIGTKHHGYVLSYLSFAKRHLEKPVPAGYSAAKAERILEEYEETDAGDTGTENPKTDKKEADKDEPVDIIVVMNEAFADLPSVYGFETNQDGLPYIHSLEGPNVKKGWMLSSVYGGTTADTEYEFLTGNPVSFLNADAVPYTQYINSTQQSLARLLKNRGYSATAFHPYLESGYKRYKVYPLLGFDDFISSEDNLTYTERIRTYISDSSDFRNLEEIYEKQKEKGPVFLFNVTMQNHGSYDTDVPAVDVTVEPEKAELHYAQLEEYLSLAYQTDRAFEELTKYFEKSDRKTIILMFGDHQPGLNEEVLKAMAPGMYEEGASLGEREKKYTVPYIMWANFELPETPEAPEYISPNFLRSFLLENAGVSGSAYDCFVRKVRESYPAINILGYLDADGDLHDLQEAPQEELLNDYRKLAYYNLFDHGKVKMKLFTGSAGK